ncbi:hypothetical protein CRM22_003135 [Opisthorchis felineus]|uniref:GTPase Era, mitochondrial n=1 Tax=Opisthorchis felineus TaxID=147828 RepID=A0A4S2M2R8_OPIFE|nr:hypothetical protein CRM22_003135 [Opisthorchis felineus]
MSLLCSKLCSLQRVSHSFGWCPKTAASIGYRNLFILPGRYLNSLVKTSSDCPYPMATVPATNAEYFQKLLLQQPKTPPDARVLKVAVIGCPNAGKSSLVNMLVKWRVCAVAGKAHTTRSKQMAALMQDNVQVVFVDLPGLVNSSKAWSFNLEKSFIRDPHSAIFESDVILVVVDVTHRRSREELDEEVVKALHFFQDKESVLVLNKIDKARNNPTRLLEVTRRLTGGIVRNRRSHVDAYESRFLKRAKMPPSTPRLEPPSEVIAAYLPPVCHEEANKLLTHLSSLRSQLGLSVCDDTQVNLISAEPKHSFPEVRTNEADSVDTSVTSNPSFGGRTVTDVELAAIDDYFANCQPETGGRASDSEMQISRELENPEMVSTMGETETLTETNKDDIYLKSLLETLQEQLMLKSATREEVAARRKRWLDISRSVQGVSDWGGFSEVFMVSSATGDGIDRLRDYLVSKAVPGRPWMLSPLLVTDQEPAELVRMCIWAHCLNQLRQEIPYSVRIVVDDCEKANLTGDEGDDRVFVHARIQCRSERHLRHVLGPSGNTIRDIAAAVKLELMSMFRANTVVKLTAEMASVNPTIMRKLRRAEDFAEVFPEQGRAHS